MSAFYTPRTAGENHLNADVIVHQTDHLKTRPTGAFTFRPDYYRTTPPEGYEDRALMGLLQMLSTEPKYQAEMHGAIHAAAVETHHDEGHAAMAGLVAKSGEEIVYDAGQAKELVDTAKGFIAHVAQAQQGKADYHYSETDRQYFALVKQLYSAVVSMRVEEAQRVMAKPNGGAEALKQIQEIRNERNALKQLFDKLSPPPVEEPLNLTAIAYEGVNTIFLAAMEQTGKKNYYDNVISVRSAETQRNQHSSVRLSEALRMSYPSAVDKYGLDGGAPDGGFVEFSPAPSIDPQINSLLDMAVLLKHLEDDGAKQFSATFGKDMPGREVMTGQVGFTNGEPMGTTYLYDEIAVIVRCRKEGEHQGVMAMAVMDDNNSCPEFISGVFDAFLKRHPGVELKDLTVTMVGGKTNNKFKNYNPERGLPNINHMQGADVQRFQKEAGPGALTALRVLDYATKHGVAIGHSMLFHEEQPAAFVANGKGQSLELTYGRPQQKRSNPEAAQLISKFGFNSRLGNVAFDGAQDTDTPLLITRPNLDAATGIYNGGYAFQLMNMIKDIDKEQNHDRGTIGRFALLTLVSKFHAFMHENPVPMITSQFNESAQKAARKHVRGDSQQSHAQHAVLDDISRKGFTMAGLGDERKFNHSGIIRIAQQPHDKLFKKQSRKVKDGAGRERTVDSLGVIPLVEKALERESAAMEQAAAAYTVGPFSRFYQQELQARQAATPAIG